MCMTMARVAVAIQNLLTQSGLERPQALHHCAFPSPHDFDCEIYSLEEIFGPVLLCMQANSLQETIQLVNSNKCGMGQQY
jgi:hypothetical protein